MKYVKLPKKYRITKSNPAIWRISGSVYWGHLFGLKYSFLRYPLWVLRPVCWLKGHKNKVLYPYGVKIKQCKRCAKEFYRKPIKGESDNKIFSGEIGNLYGVRFMTTDQSEREE